MVGIYAKQKQDFEFVGNVNFDHFHYLKRHIQSKEKGGFEQHLHSILEKGGWKNNITPSDYQTILFQPILDIFLRSNISLESIKLLNQKRNKFNSVKDYIISNENDYRPIDLTFLLKKDIITLLNQNIKEFDYIINALWHLKPIINRVSVGKGEIVLTIFSNIKKGKTGDLYIDGLGDIEVKGNYGRVGSGTRLVSTQENFPKMLKDNNNFCLYSNYHFYQVSQKIDNYKNKLVEDINHVKQRINNINISGRSKYSLLDKQNYVQQLNSLLDIVNKVSNTKNDFVYDIEKYVNICDQIPKNLFRKNIITYGKSLIELKQNFYHPIYNITPTLSFISQGVFLSNPDQNSKKFFTDCLFELRNEDVLTNKQLDTLYNEIEMFFNKRNIVNLFSKEQGYKNIKKIVFTLHCVCYYLNYNFPYLLLINDDTKKCLFINFSPKNETLFENVYKQIENFNFNISMSIDKQSSTGVSVLLNE